MRRVTACNACRASKRKCRIEARDQACRRCRALGLACSLTPPKSPPVIPLVQVSPGFLPGGSPGNQRPSRVLQQELVALYFHEIHDTHHSIFHRPTVEQRVQDGTLPDVLLYSMMALGARFSDNRVFQGRNRRQRGEPYAAQAKGLLDLTAITVDTIQACILLGTLCFSDSQTQSEALYYSIAVRLALILDLPRRVCHSEVERQVNLRIWWSLYMIDIWSSAGLNLPRQLEYRDEYSLPADEEVFLGMRWGDSSNNNKRDRNSRGLWSEMIVLSGIWARTHTLNQDQTAPSLDAVDELVRDLYDWNAALPPDLQENEENLDRYVSQGLGNAFAALHLGYHYYHEVLCYQFLTECPNEHSHGYKNEKISRYRSLCTEHALAFCSLLYKCRQITSRNGHEHPCQCRYVMVGHMLVVTSTVYMHLLLFSADTDTVRLVRQRLTHNFAILTELQSFWVTLDVAVGRLQVFHAACAQSIDRSWEMDRWMRGFILEHGSYVVERPVEPRVL